MREREKQIVLDFDNFLTDGDKEKFAYQEIYLQNFCEWFQIEPEWAYTRFSLAESDVQRNPQSNLYAPQGFPVGAGTSDHMLLTFSTAKRLLEQWRKQRQHTDSTLEYGDIRIFTRLYAESYPKTGTIYRHGARELIKDLFKTKRLSIVSGSDTIAVQRKLIALLKTTGINVYDLDIHGNAQKTNVDRSIPTPHYAPWILSEFPYPLYFHRPKFEAVISHLPHPVGVAASDQYSGDLSQYEHEHAYTIFLRTHFTAPWEPPVYRKHPNGIAVTTLEEVRSALEPFV